MCLEPNNDCYPCYSGVWSCPPHHRELTGLNPTYVVTLLVILVTPCVPSNWKSLYTFTNYLVSEVSSLSTLRLFPWRIEYISFLLVLSTCLPTPVNENKIFNVIKTVKSRTLVNSFSNQPGVLFPRVLWYYTYDTLGVEKGFYHFVRLIWIKNKDKRQLFKVFLRLLIQYQILRDFNREVIVNSWVLSLRSLRSFGVMEDRYKRGKE